MSKCKELLEKYNKLVEAEDIPKLIYGYRKELQEFQKSFDNKEKKFKNDPDKLKDAYKKFLKDYTSKANSMAKNIISKIGSNGEGLKDEGTENAVLSFLRYASDTIDQNNDGEVKKLSKLFKSVVKKPNKPKKSNKPDINIELKKNYDAILKKLGVN